MQGWGKGHLNPQLFESSDRTALAPLPIALVKIVMAQILIRDVAGEQIITDRENRVADG